MVHVTIGLQRPVRVAQLLQSRPPMIAVAV
jgi:hypothetical protein